MERREFLKLGLTGIGTLALAKNADALEFYPKPSDKKWAVLYATWCGTSRDAGVWISEGMGGIAAVFDVQENPDLKGFDHIVIGGSIRSMATSEALQDYIAKNRRWLQPKVRGLFAVCGNREKPVGPEQTKILIDNHLAKLCDVSNIPSRVFNGRITKSLMEPEVAQMMAAFYPKMMGKPLEDYDYLKRADCMAFGQEVLQNMR